MIDIFDNFPSVKEKFQQDRKTCFHHKNGISAILSQKTRCIGILKQENVSLIALFALSDTENTCAPFSEADSKKRVMDTDVTIQYICENAIKESLPIYGTIEDVSWLSYKRILQRFPVLGIRIQDFLETKGMMAKNSIIKDKKGQCNSRFSLYHTAYERAKI